MAEQQQVLKVPIIAKIPGAHKNNIGTSTPPFQKSPNPPPLKGGILWAWGFSSRNNQKCQAPIKLAQPFPAPGKVTDLRLFMIILAEEEKAIQFVLGMSGTSSREKLYSPPCVKLDLFLLSGSLPSQCFGTFCVTSGHVPFKTYSRVFWGRILPKSAPKRTNGTLGCKKKSCVCRFLVLSSTLETQ